MVKVATRRGIGLSNASGGNLVGAGNFRRAFAVNDTSFTVVGVIANQLSGASSRYFAQIYNGAGQAAVISGYVADTIEFFATSYTGTDPRPGSQMVVTDNLPHAFCYTYDGAIWSGYLDGQLVFSVARTFSLALLLPTSATLMSATGAAAESRSTLLLWAAMDRGIGTLGQSVTANPWQLYAPLPRRIWAPAAGAPATGASAQTLPVTGTAAGTLAVAGASAQVLPVTGAAAGALAVAGASAQTLPVTGAAAGALAVAGASAQTIPITGAGTAALSISAASSQQILVTGIAAGTVPAPGPGATAAQIWGYVMANGQTAEQNILAILARSADLVTIHGLVISQPLTVTPTQRTAGAIVQTISEVGTAITVTRQ